MFLLKKLKKNWKSQHKTIEVCRQCQSVTKVKTRKNKKFGGIISSHHQPLLQDQQQKHHFTAKITQDHQHHDRRILLYRIANVSNNDCALTHSLKLVCMLHEWITEITWQTTHYAAIHGSRRVFQFHSAYVSDAAFLFPKMSTLQKPQKT